MARRQHSNIKLYCFSKISFRRRLIEPYLHINIIKTCLKTTVNVFFNIYFYHGTLLTYKQSLLFKDNGCPDVDPLTFPMVAEQLKKGIKTTNEWLKKQSGAQYEILWNNHWS